MKATHLETWKASAERSQRSLSDWVRRTLQTHVDRELNEISAKADLDRLAEKQREAFERVVPLRGQRAKVAKPVAKAKAKTGVRRNGKK